MTAHCGHITLISSPIVFPSRMPGMQRHTTSQAITVYSGMEGCLLLKSSMNFIEHAHVIIT